MYFATTLPHEPGSIPAARRVLRRLEGEIDELTLRNARLLVSELVTNAVRHVPAGEDDEIELVVDRDDRRVRIEVADRGPGFDPEIRHRTSGFGLRLLDKLASDWGVERTGRGCRVWFQVDRSSGRFGRD